MAFLFIDITEQFAGAIGALSFGMFRLMLGAVTGSIRRHSKETPPEPIASRRFSGKFMVPIPPELHRRLVMDVQEEGINLNRLASNKLSRQDL